MAAYLVISSKEVKMAAYSVISSKEGENGSGSGINSRAGLPENVQVQYLQKIALRAENPSGHQTIQGVIP